MKIETTKISLYVLGILLVIISRITSMLSYNLAMTLATILLVATFLLDAYEAYKKRSIWKMILLIFVSLVLIFLLVFLWNVIL